MLVVAKTRHIDLRIQGNKIPATLMRSLRSHFGSRLRVQEGDDEARVNIMETPWFKETSVSPGFALKTYRDNADFSQEVLAEKLGLSPANGRKHVSDMEHDRKAISKKTALRLSQIFNVPADRFLQ